MRHFRVVRTAALVLLTTVFCFAVPTAVEYELKAEFVWRFTLFVEWPEDEIVSSADPFLIGVIGTSPITDQLKNRTAGQRVGDRPVFVRTIDRRSAIAECDIVFIAGNAGFTLAEILERTDDRPILTVGESEGFAERGTLINLYLDEGKVRIEINRAAVQRSGLDFASKLYRVARIVDEGNG